MIKGKTVYILGAGCSKADGLPMQAGILKEIFQLKLYTDIDISHGIMDTPVKPISRDYLERYQRFEGCRNLLAEFLLSNFGTFYQKSKMTDLLNLVEETEIFNEKRLHLEKLYLMASELRISLEDVFTILDKIDMQREHWREYSGLRISKVNDALKKCIIYVVCYQMTQIHERKVYTKFSELLIRDRIAMGREQDGLSVITMNWDTMLEQELYKMCRSNPKKVMPDYCFYNDSFQENTKWIPSVLLKTKKYYNIKVLKLHGSFNWLICPRCGRMLVDYEDNIAAYVLGADKLEMSYCRFCSNDFQLENRPLLESLFVSPTYIKVFQDASIKNIWHNAFIELSEATKIVFIGYSFPNADFEFKHLLKKSLKPDCAIDVVLTNSDNPNYYDKLLGRTSRQKKDEIISRLDIPSSRYDCFFGAGRITYHYEGAETYLKGTGL